MNVKSRVERLERERGDGAEVVRFRVVVPPKMSREEWRRYCRERPGPGELSFPVNLEGAGAAED